MVSKLWLQHLYARHLDYVARATNISTVELIFYFNIHQSTHFATRYTFCRLLFAVRQCGPHSHSTLRCWFRLTFGIQHVRRSIAFYAFYLLPFTFSQFNNFAVKLRFHFCFVRAVRMVQIVASSWKWPILENCSEIRFLNNTKSHLFYTLGRKLSCMRSAIVVAV